MHSSGDEDETGTGDGGIGFRARGGDEEVRKCGFDGIVGPKDIDVDDGFEGIGAELGYAGEEVASCAGSVGMKNTISSSSTRARSLAGKTVTHMTISMLPNSFAHLSTALLRLSTLLTSTPPIPMTVAPCLAVIMSAATRSVFSTFRPTMHALAPKSTRART